MEKAEIRPLATPKPLNQFSPKLAGVIRLWTAPDTQTFVAIGPGVSAPQIRDITMPFDVTIIFTFVLFGFFNKATAYIPKQIFLRKTRQKTSFPGRKCLLVVPTTIRYVIFRHLNLRKTTISETVVDWTCFFCGRKLL